MNFLTIESTEADYETLFKYFQIEITGKCNEACVHCRASVQPGINMSRDLFRTIVRFGAHYLTDDGEVVISGGEPFVHSDWKSLLNILAEEGIRRISITSNGLIFSSKHAEFLSELPMENIFLAFSLDSAEEKTHNSFRRNKKAYSGVLKAIEIANRYENLKVGIRASVWDLDEMDGIVSIAKSLGCGMVGFSDIHMFGEALKHKHLLMNKCKKELFHQKIFEIERSSRICIGTSDPLYNNGRDNTAFRDGCGAGYFTFNANVDGTITPCAFLPQVIATVIEGMSVENISEMFSKSAIVHDLIEMRYNGKCGRCKAKEDCGGCRARAFAYTGNYLDEDPHCYY
jgi:radical SAM protein with 4Fe4S-binding SPASM domain